MRIESIVEETGSGTFPYKLILISFIIVTYFWEQYLNYRQLTRTLIREIPQELRIYDIAQHQFSYQQNYAFEKISFQMLALSIKKAVECLCIIANVLPFIWSEMDVIFPFIDMSSEFQKAVGFVIIEAFYIKAFAVPFSVYENYVIERRYNNNVKSFSLFMYDMLIESFLLLIIYPPIIYGYLRIVELGGDYFFLFTQVFILLVTLVLSEIHPNLIAPLFNKFNQLKDPLLNLHIHHLANVTNFPLKKIYWINSSIRSAHSNAYFYGFGRNKMIVLFDTLLKDLNQQETTAVVCHEIGHWAKSHSYKMLCLYIFKGFAMFYMFSYFIKSDHILHSFGFNQQTTFIGTALFFQLSEPLLLIFETAQLVLNRKFQFEADIYACKANYGKQLRSALIKVTNETTVVPPDPLFAWFKFSHPRLHERVTNINNFINQYQHRIN